jgi:hypothetical protein
MQQIAPQPVQAETQIAIERMHAYFHARRQGASQRERERLEQEWLAAVRRLRSAPR